MLLKLLERLNAAPKALQSKHRASVHVENGERVRKEALQDLSQFPED